MYSVREMMFGTRDTFLYFQCSNCGCLQITHTPANLGSYYPTDYYSFNRMEEDFGLQKRPLPRAFLEKLRARTALFGKGFVLNRLAASLVDLPPALHSVGPLLKKCGIKSNKAQFLDVGCGSPSWWLSQLRSLGFKKLTGVDPHIKEDNYKNGIRIIKAELDDVAGKFDLITLHHSLEHIPDQVGTLKAVEKRLSEKGRCLIRVPLVSSLVWDMYGVNWVELDAPRHLYLHSSKSIELIAKAAGLELVSTFWDSGPFQFYGSEQYRRDIPLTADNSFWKNPSNSDFTYKEMAHFKALAKMADKEGKGGRGGFIFKRGVV